MEGVNQNDNMGVIPDTLSQSSKVEQNPDQKELNEIFKKVPEVSRRDFLRIAGIAALGLLAACAPKPFQDTLRYATEPNSNPTSTPELEKYAYVRDPQRLNSNDFIKGAGHFPSAIVERSPFAKNDRGEPLFLRYGGQFSEVTFLHSTGQKPPVVGEILPIMYKVPSNTSVKEVDVVPYAISTGSESKKVDLNDGKIHYVVPIVTTGTSKGIVQKIENNQVVNQPYQPFEVAPDSVSGSTQGFLSWAVLTEIGNEVVVEGVATSNSGIYIDPNSVPNEVSEVIGK